MKICFVADANSIHTYRWVSPLVERWYEIVLVSHTPIRSNLSFEFPVIDLPKMVNLPRVRFLVWGPVLASEVTGLEFITHHELGLSFKPGNVPDLASKLKQLLDLPPETRSQIGQRARQYVVQHHSWDSVANLIWDRANWFFTKESNP